MKHYRR